MLSPDPIAGIPCRTEATVQRPVDCAEQPAHPQYAIFLYCAAGVYMAQVPSLPKCGGRGESCAVALRAAEQAIDAWVVAATKAGHALPPAASPERMMKALSRCVPKVSPWPPGGGKSVSIKAQLVKKFGELSRRDLALCIGLVAPDAPVMLSTAAAGEGTRAVRCAIAVALGEAPSSLWPENPLHKRRDDDIAFELLRQSRSVPPAHA